MKGAMEPQRPQVGTSDSDGALRELEGSWRVERRLGRGGMGTVYLAHDLALHRPVAIKVMASHFCDDAALVERFEREARLMAKLDHPNLVPVYTVGRTSRGPYIVMKLLEGMTLGELLKSKGHLTLDEALGATRQLAAGLQYIHDQHVVHRDVKPSNIYVGPDGHVTLLDFGVARDRSSDLTGSGVLVGTPRYMAPEVLQGGAADHRSDLYSLATVMFEMLTGKPMVDADSERSVLRAHASGLPLDRSQLGDVPPAVNAALLKALAKAPEERFESVAEFIRALDAAGDEWAGEAKGPETRFAPLSVVRPMTSSATRLEPLETPARPALSPWRRAEAPEAGKDSEHERTRTIDRAPPARSHHAPRTARRVALWSVLGLLAILTAGGAFLLWAGPAASAVEASRGRSPRPPGVVGAPLTAPTPEEPRPGEAGPDEAGSEGVGLEGATTDEAPSVEEPVDDSTAPSKGTAKPSRRTRRTKYRKPGIVQAAPGSGKAAEADTQELAMVRCVATANRAAVRAYVEVDGLRQGATPMTLKLEPGSHRLDFLREGFKPQSRKLTLASGDSVNLSVDLASE